MKKNFSKHWHIKVAELIIANRTMDEIAKYLNVNVSIVRKSVRDYSYLTIKKISPVCFGYKNTAYFTEEEMLDGYKPPKYSDLSETEKQIYDK